MLEHLALWARGRMQIGQQGELQLSEFQYLVPCLEWSDKCNLDWAAVSAMGGWVAAIVTFFAVLLPFRQYRNELRSRRDSENADGEVAALSCVAVLSSIHTGLEAIQAALKEPDGFDDFVESLDAVSRFIASSPLPAIPRAGGLNTVRVAMASLDASLTTIKGYVVAYDEGLFNTDSVRQYLVSLTLAYHFFDDAVAELDSAFPAFKFPTVLTPLKEE